MKKFTFALLALAFIVSFQSCKKDDNKDYDIPTTYNFSDVDYSGQTTRLKMITALVAEVRKGTVAGTVLDATLLKNMYSNSLNPFTNDTLNTSGKQLKDKTFATEQAVIDAWLDGAATASLNNNNTASSGTAGILTNGNSRYLVDANGLEYKEAVEKGLQGGLIYYQITGVYLSEDKVGAQVALATRQHHWDEAFGYFGVPVDYTANTDINLLQHVGRYCHGRNALLGNSTATMNAFLKGRAAINNGDDETVTEQVAIIRDNIEKGWAGTAVHYINGALADLSNAGARHHQLSEGYFIIKSLRYNPGKKITDAQIQTLLDYFGNNFYTVSESNLQAAKNLLSTIYGFDAVKDQL